MSRYRDCWPEILLLAAALVLRLTFAMLPLSTLLVLLEDDAWMVAGIARHWALGHGITADGLNPTNGFHPLYPLTLGAIPYLINGGLDFGFRANLLICALLSTLALIPFYGLARALARRPLALAGLAIMGLNPLLIRVSVNGMETSLALLLLLWLWWYALVRQPRTPRQGALLGLLAGLAALARLDNLVAIGLLGLVLFLRELRSQHAGAAELRSWRLPLISLTYGAVCGLLLLPYFARNLLEFDSLMPSSGRALSYLHSFRGDFTFSSGLGLVAYQPAFDFSGASMPVLLLGLLALVAMCWSLQARHRRILLPLLLYALAVTFYYSYIQQNGHPRYYVAVGATVALLVCASAGELAQSPRRLAGLAATLALGTVLLNGSLFARRVAQELSADSLAQPAMYEAARWIAANLPPQTRLASQNSGIFQYYSDHVVLNFDGKLNHEIIPVLERRELDHYLRSEGVNYVVDLHDVVSDYLEFYSAGLSEARPHPELSGLDKLAIYAQLIAARLKLGRPVELELRQPTRVLIPFEEAATVVRQFPLPNNPARSVTIFQLKESFGRR